MRNVSSQTAHSVLVVIDRSRGHKCDKSAIVLLFRFLIKISRIDLFIFGNSQLNSRSERMGGAGGMYGGERYAIQILILMHTQPRRKSFRTLKLFKIELVD